MGLDVIAEGVETEAQLEFLHLHGCHIYQGYLFGKPMPIAELEVFFQRCENSFPDNAADYNI